MHQKKKKNDNIRKYNILDIINNVSSVFTGTYLHYNDIPKEAMFERSIAERTKLKKGRYDEIKTTEQNIKNELFKSQFTDYQSPSNMYRKLIQTNDTVNEVRVNSFKKVLSELKRITEYTPKDDVAKIKENEKMVDVVERILEFNNKIQSGQGLKILTLSQMLCRLPIFFSSIKCRK